MFEAAAHAANPTSGRPVDPMADFDQDQQDTIDLRPVIAAVAATQRQWAELYVKGGVTLDTVYWENPKGGWLTMAEAIASCQPLMGHDMWLTIYLPGGVVADTIALP